MKTRMPIRRLLPLVYLCVLFGAAGWVYSHIQHFEGIMLVAKGAAEGVVVRPSEGGLSLATAQRNMPAEVISFDNPNLFRRFLGDKEAYDAVETPFHLRLDEIEILEERPPREIVEVMGPGAPVSCEAKPGMRLPLSDSEITVKEVRRWSGLIRNAAGKPMAALSLRRPGERWTEHIFLDAGAWRFVEPGVALLCRWFSSEAEAREKLPNSLEGAAGARWGVTEGKKTHWFQSLQPGTGVVLDDETEVTLLQYDEKHAGQEGVRAALLVELKRASGTEQKWVEVNRHDPSAILRFEDPASAESVVFLNAWRDGAGLMRVFQRGKVSGESLEREGGVWKPGADNRDAFPYEIRLDQVMPAAIPVLAAGDPVYEAILQTSTGEIPLREGEMVTWNKKRFRYRRMDTPPRVRQHFTVIPRGGEKKWSFALGPGESRRVATWLFTQSPEHTDAVHSALLMARRTFGGPVRWAGAVLLLLGAFGFVWWRGRQDEFLPPEPAESSEEQ